MQGLFIIPYYLHWNRVSDKCALIPLFLSYKNIFSIEYVQRAQSELCTDEATTHLELSWDTDHHLEATCYKPGDPTSEYNPDLMLGKAASTDIGGRVVCQESLPEMSCEDTGLFVNQS